MLFTKRWSLYTNEKSVVGILKALNLEKSWIFSDNIAASVCGWTDEPDTWVVYFDATPKRFGRIIQALTELGSLQKHTNPNGLYFTIEESH